MVLKDWLSQRDIPPADFARRVGCSRTHLYRYLRGDRVPGRQRIMRIHTLTDGAVTADDWFGIANKAGSRPRATGDAAS